MGAPKGNSNALKHGLYAKHFSPADQAALRAMPPQDYRYEINLLRVTIKRLFEIHTRLHQMVESALQNDQPCDVESLAKISNSLSLAVTALSTTARTHALLTGNDANLNDAFEQALKTLPIFIDEQHQLESRSDAEDQEEITIE